MRLTLTLVFVSVLSLAAAEDSQAQFTNAGTWNAGGLSPYGLAVGDLDGNGTLDAITATRGGANLWVSNNGSGVFSAGQTLTGSNNTLGVAVGDLDNDGDLDAFFANAFQNNDNCNTVTCQSNRVFLNNGTGSFTDTWNDGIAGGSWDVKLADFNQDGYLDAVVANITGATPSQLYLNDGAGAFGMTATALPGIQSQGVAVADFDGVNGPDIVFGDGTVLLNDGSASFTSSSLGVFGSRARTGDVNGDGNVDVVLVGNYAANRVYLGNGAGGFTAGSVFGVTNAPRFDAVLGDVDNDGDLDLMVAGYTGAYLFVNDGSGVFSAGTTASTGQFTVALADFDGDTDLDALRTGPQIYWRNDTFTVTVTTTADSGAGSLREAITTTNSSANGPYPDRIHFAIPGAGPHTIALATALPAITEAVYIDGFTQSGSSPNSNALAVGSNADIRIELDGDALGSGNGLELSGGASTVRGLAIGRFPSAGIRLNSDGNTVDGIYLGTDVTGLLDRGNGGSGIDLRSSNNQGGGTSPAARVVSSGNGNGFTFEPGANDNTFEGAYVGVDASGAAALANTNGFLSNQGLR
ncbi:MAG: VCBS repeat-containing protein, partial [Rhodothermales bacterium]|nr:VCBS repeat-containing protein [Rhodothermales bacterium]